jgi:hypothetical protein
MRVSRRRLPLQVKPLDGESIDSWLEATALAAGLTLGALAAAGGLPATARPSWRNCLSPTEALALSAATGLTTSALQAMTLSRYDGLALRLDPETRRSDPRFPFGALSWSRFCPACLNETHGRWQLVWRLGWSFACLRHNCLLVDVCPECDDHQRSTQLYRRVPSPAACRCGHPLDAVPTLLMPSDRHSILLAQRKVHELVNKGQCRFGVFEAHPKSQIEVLAAVRSFTNRALNSASENGISVSDVFEEATGQESVECIYTQARETLNNKAPLRALDAAVGMCLAIRVLEQPTISAAGDRARWIIEGQNATTGPAEIRSCKRDGEISAAILLKARSADLGPELQLQYRTATIMPRVPVLDQRRDRAMAARLPATLWSEWARQMVSDLRPTVVVRETLSCGALVVGSTLKAVESAQLLGERHTAEVLNQRLWTLCLSEHWNSISAALIRLSDFLREQGGIVDYERRRRLDYSNLLTEGFWRQKVVGNANSLLAGTSAVPARCYMIGRISGSPTLALLTHPEFDQRSLKTLVTSFGAGLTPPVTAELDQLARGFLTQQGIVEPVHWHPPLDLLDGLEFR